MRQLLTSSDASSIPRRRMLIAGAGTAAALTAASLASPGRNDARASSATDRTLEPGDGYRLTQHVQRYYRTARV